MATKRTLDEMIASLKEREKGSIEAQEYKLEKSYETVPDLIKSVSALSGIAPRRLLRQVALATMHYEQVLNWRQVMELLHSFYVIGNNANLMEGYEEE